MDNQVDALIQTVTDYYARNARILPWRVPDTERRFDPYKILISEMMLQQTQVPRVIPKYISFLSEFPSVQDLANARLADVLIQWSGLGYNRRARFLHEAAKMVVDRWGGTIPDGIDRLVKLPGVGYNTAAAISVYTYNRPEVFVETNIRTVYIHHFFDDQAGVADNAITLLLAQTIQGQDPRTFYWALMDYGAYLKRAVGNKAKQSKQYTKQSKFEGSTRQLRGKVLRLLAERSLSSGQLKAEVQDDRLGSVLEVLCGEGLISKSAQLYTLG